MSAEREDLLAGLGAPAGLCESCRFGLLNRTKRGTVFLRCALAAEDDRFIKYPRLPVLRCAGFRPPPPDPAPESESESESESGS